MPLELAERNFVAVEVDQGEVGSGLAAQGRIGNGRFSRVGTGRVGDELDAVRLLHLPGALGGMPVTPA